VLLPDSRADFTANRLVLALSVSRPVAVAMLEDLTKPEVERIAIGNPDSVPAGRHARSALEKAGLWEKLQTTLINVQNVRQVLDYEARGEVDAGFVYATDQMTMPYRVKAALQVPTPERIRYPVAVVKGGRGATCRAAVRCFRASRSGRQDARAPWLHEALVLLWH
jgi:molybdate transport system substrate-binding protein